MYRNSRIKSVNEDNQPNLTDFFDKKYREKILVGNADQIDQRSDDNDRRDTEDIQQDICRNG